MLAKGKAIALILLFLVVVGCGGDDDGWTSEEISGVTNSCVDKLELENIVNYRSINFNIFIYCACMTEELSSRFSPKDAMSKPFETFKTLENEGAYQYCFSEAS